MFSKSLFTTLFAYHWYTNARLLDLSANLSEADYKNSSDYGHGSIHDLLVHLLQTDWAWRQALETGQQQSPLLAEDFPHLAALRNGFEREREAWQSLLEGLEAGEFEAEISLTTRRGSIRVFPRWRILQHVVLHGMQHHAELAQMLTAKGQPPGNIDFIFFS